MSGSKEGEREIGREGQREGERGRGRKKRREGEITNLEACDSEVHPVQSTSVVGAHLNKGDTCDMQSQTVEFDSDCQKVATLVRQ